jgi:hypothetical protein
VSGTGSPELDALIARWREIEAKMTPEQRAAQRRESAISWALGNLNMSTNHRTTREVVEAAYDRLHPPSKPQG